MQSSGRVNDLALNVFTDAPTRVVQLPGGFLDFDTSCNVIVARKTSDLSLNPAETRLSIRCAFNGQRHFSTNEGRFVVDDNAYLIFNQGEVITSDVQSSTPVECFNITFKPEFAGETLRSLVTPEDRLLEEPRQKSVQPVSFFVRTYPYDTPLAERLLRLRKTLPSQPVTHGWLEEEFHALIETMLQTHRNVLREVETMPGVRAATRQEAYKRLHHARDFIHASLQQPITLNDIAQEACLAPHHFLRQFKQAFHETPHQYLTRIRLERARFLLRKSDLPITDICLSVGFESLGSFSWLFKKTYGFNPSEFRRESYGIA